MLTVVVIATSG